MKRIGNIYDKISSLENLEVADNKARKGKLKSYGVQKHTKIQAENLKKLHEVLEKCEYKTSSYDIFKIYAIMCKSCYCHSLLSEFLHVTM